MASLSTGHAAADLAQGAVPAIVVYLTPRLGLSYTMAAAVVLVGTLSSSIVQPLFGHWSDRRGALWLLSGGVAIASLGIALAAVAPTYPLLLLAVLVSGLGVAAFHPEGAKFASYASGARRASGMAVFSVGGNVGFGLGPLVGSAAIAALGLEGGLLLAVPGVVVAALLLSERGYVGGFEPRPGTAPQARPDDQPKAFALLLVVVALRSVAHYGLFTFVPLYEVAKGGSAAAGTRLLSYFLLAGALGTLLGGPLADRYGRKPVVFWTHALTVPLIVVYVLVGGLPGDAALVLAGALVISTFGITVVMSQEYMPSRIATAAGLSVGLAIGLGGVFAVSLGAVADSLDLETAMLAIAAGPALGALVALTLPRAAGRVLVQPTAPASTT